jgi:hypothetical protein
MRFTLISVFALACAGTSTDTDNTQDTDGNPQVVMEGDCEKDLSEWTTEGDYQEMSVTGDGYLLTPLTTHILHSQEDLDAFTAEYEINIEGADFALHSILVAAGGASSTCGMSDPSMDVWFLLPDMNGSSGPDSRGGIHLNFEMTDYSGTCDSVCDMTWSQVKAIAVSGPHTDPFEKDYSVCAKLLNTCS